MPCWHCDNVCLQQLMYSTGINTLLNTLLPSYKHTMHMQLIWSNTLKRPNFLYYLYLCFYLTSASSMNFFLKSKFLVANYLKKSKT